MTILKSLKSNPKYSVRKTEGGEYYLFSSIPKGRSAMPYLCSFVYDSDKAEIQFDGLKFSNIDAFEIHLGDYLGKLEFDSDNYYPGFRKGVFEKYSFDDTFESLLSGDGFSEEEAIRVSNGFEDIIVSNKVNYDFTNSKVKVNGLHSYENFRRKEANDLYSAIDFAKEHYWLTLTMTLLGVAEKLSQIPTPDKLNFPITMDYFDKKTMWINTQDFKDEIISKAKSLIEKLEAQSK